jgi:alpha-galactosidase
VCDPDASETHGRVYATALAYSGNCIASVERDQFDAIRVALGVNLLTHTLDPWEFFETPAAFLVASASGFGTISGEFHHLLRDGVVARAMRRRPRPIIINSWEAMYFDVSAERVARLARDGNAIGAELLVLDDGWFSRRRDDTSSLGDWTPNEERFPGGLGPVADEVRREGLEFGFWIEPEMVSPDSDLYRRHPEWSLQIAGRPQTTARNQLVLDLGNRTVREYLFDTISSLIDRSGAAFIKWDMNRTITEAGVPGTDARRQGGVMHRYILGLYDLLRRLTEAYPEVIIEGCAGGGGRMDLGLARYCPRFWTSDQTDAVARLPIQYGTSLLFPPEMIGAHVSAVPNHQVGRTTPASTRVLTALPFSFGFELDPSRESDQERATYRRGAELSRALREWIIDGAFHRLRGPLASAASRTTDEYAWCVVSADRSRVAAFLYRPFVVSQTRGDDLRLTGLDRGARYRDLESGTIFDSVYLEERGYPVAPAATDYDATMIQLEREAE